jgi:pimeloyl-ACP methyl ester carboxylesterase
MAEDEAFVARNLAPAAPRLRGIIDRGRAAVVGHSMGGMAATAACWRYRVFDACVSLDGLVWARNGNTALGEPPNPVAKPLLLLLAPQFLPPDFSIAARRYHRVWPRLSLCLLPGSRHNSVSDLPLLRQTEPAAGELPAAAAAEIMQRAVVSFLSSALGESPVPAGSEPAGSSLRSSLRTVPGDSVAGCTLRDR